MVVCHFVSSAIMLGESNLPYDVEPLSLDRLADLDAVFGARGCAEARRCYCMYYRRAGSWPELAPGETLAARNRADLLALLGRGIVPGLLAYREGRPLGWVSLGPREDVRLRLGDEGSEVRA